MIAATIIALSMLSLIGLAATEFVKINFWQPLNNGEPINILHALLAIGAWVSWCWIALDTLETINKYWVKFRQVEALTKLILKERVERE